MLTIGLIGADYAAIILSGLGAYSYSYETVVQPFNYYLVVLAATVFVNAMALLGGYRAEAVVVSLPRFATALATWGSVLVAIITMAYLFKVSNELPRTWLGAWCLIGAGVLSIERVLAAAIVFRWRHLGKLVTRVAIVGSRVRIAELATRLNSPGYLPIEMVAAFERECEVDGAAAGIDELVSLAQTNAVDDIVIADQALADPELQHLIRTLRSFAVNVWIFPDVFRDLPAPAKIGVLSGIPMLSVGETPLVGWKRLAKRGEDLVLSMIFILLALPLMLLIAIAIKIDSRGPVLFCQPRFGFNCNHICVYKFRTMKASSASDPTAPQARRGDERITRLGRFLRRSSLDELPQLFNVVLGDMSLVGPRPHPVALNERFAATVDDYLARHCVKPGITGWAQVNGLRGETDTAVKMELRIKYDLYYIKNWSVLFDLKILFRTLRVFTDKSAY